MGTQTESVVHSALKVWGFINDRIPEGFKTPAFINGHFHLQKIDEAGLVAGFESYDDTIDRPVIRPNQSLDEFYSVVGKPPIYLFKSSLGEIIAGRKHSIVPKLRQWIRREDTVSPSVAFDVLMFIGASDERLSEAAENLAKSLDVKKSETKARYQARLNELIRSRIRRKDIVDDSYRIRENSKRVSINILEVELSNAISSAEGDLKRILEEGEERYIAWNLNNEDGPHNATAAQVRALLPLLLDMEGDDARLHPIRDLLRYVYFTNLLKRFDAMNKARGNGDMPAISMPPPEIANLLACSSSNFVYACIRLLAYVPPRVRRDGWVPTKSLVVGELIAISDEEFKVSNGGKTFSIEKSLVSHQAFHNRMDIGDAVIFSVRPFNKGSTRGVEYVSSILRLFFPYDMHEDLPVVEMGASNSWAVLIMNPEDKQRILRNRGTFVQQLCESLGLRRITVTNRRGESAEDRLKQFKDFINSAWSDLIIEKFDDAAFDLRIVVDDVERIDLRKLRTFASMVSKLYPRHRKSLQVADATAKRIFDLTVSGVK